MIITLILITVIVLLISISIFFIRNLLRQNKELESMIINERNYIHDRLTSTLTRLREIDSIGAFESDDEVGSIFTDIKQLIEETRDDI